MNHTLSVTYNIDTIIQNLQTTLYNELLVTWNTTKLDAYGRVYKNERKDGVMPEVYDATTRQYKEVFYNNQSCFFFVVSDEETTEDEVNFKTTVRVVFMVNLSDIKTETERVDADVKRDVTTLLRNDYIFKIKKYIKGIDNVFRGLSTKKFQGNDIQPLHVFAFDCEVEYLVTDKCT